MSIYYVSQSGSNSGNGSESKPFKTIQQAVDKAGAGDTIYVRKGSYDGVEFDNKNGTASKPITLAAYPGDEGDVSIGTGSYSRGKGIHIEDSSHIMIRGLNIKKSLFGVFGTRSKGITLENNFVHDIGQEAVHFRGDSRDIKILNNKISDTGRRGGSYARFSEGIYLGAGRPDYPGEGAHNILVKGNEISNTKAEAIDIKPSVSNVVVEDNLIYDIETARSGAVVVGINSTDSTDFPNADNVIIRNNKIWNVSKTSPYLDGNAIKAESSATIHDNVIWNYQHRGIFVERARSDNNFKIFNNELYSSGASGSKGDIVVAKTSANVEERQNAVSDRSPSTPNSKFSFNSNTKSEVSPEPAPSPEDDTTESVAPEPTPSPELDNIDSVAPEAAPEVDPMPTSGSSAESIRVEAESMDLSTYQVKSNSSASGGKLISLIGGDNTDTGTATFEFSGKTGAYDVNFAYYDESDGTGTLKLSQNGKSLTEITMDQQLGSNVADSKSLTAREIQGVNLNQGDRITLMGVENGSPTTAEHARVDYIEFRPAADVVTVVGGSQDTTTDSLSGGDMGGSTPDKNEPMAPTLIEAPLDGGVMQGTAGQDLFQLDQGGIMSTIQGFEIGEDQIAIGSGKGMDSLSILQVGSNALVGDRTTGALIAQVDGVNAQDLIASADETFHAAA